MSDRAFFDTNILTYSVDRKDPRKADIAQRVLREHIAAGTGVVSYQILQEFLNVGFRKFNPPLTFAQASLYLAELVRDMEVIGWSRELMVSALHLRDRYGFSWYDCLVVGAALQAGCQTLISEDLQHLQSIGGMTIRNPF